MRTRRRGSRASMNASTSTGLHTAGTLPRCSCLSACLTPFPGYCGPAAHDSVAGVRAARFEPNTPSIGSWQTPKYAVNVRLDSAPVDPACEAGAILTITDHDVRSLYLDLLRRNLTRYGMRRTGPRGVVTGAPSQSRQPHARTQTPVRSAQARLGRRVPSGWRDDDWNAEAHQSAALR